MSNAKPIGWARRLDNYARQNGSDKALLKPGQVRRLYRKSNKNGEANFTNGEPGAKNKPTRKQSVAIRLREDASWTRILRRMVP